MAVLSRDLEAVAQQFTADYTIYVGWNLTVARSMNSYAGKPWWAAGAGYQSNPGGYFPSSNISLNDFYGKAGKDEWNCNCDCNCACGNGGGGNGGGS